MVYYIINHRSFDTSVKHKWVNLLIIIKYYFTFCPFHKILALNTFDSLIEFKEIKSSPLLF